MPGQCARLPPQVVGRADVASRVRRLARRMAGGGCGELRERGFLDVARCLFPVRRRHVELVALAGVFESLGVAFAVSFDVAVAAICALEGVALVIGGHVASGVAVVEAAVVAVFEPGLVGRARVDADGVADGHDGDAVGAGRCLVAVGREDVGGGCGSRRRGWRHRCRMGAVRQEFERDDGSDDDDACCDEHFRPAAAECFLAVVVIFHGSLA